MGSILYISKTKRPEICCATGVLFRYKEQSIKTHWKTALHVLRYIRKTKKNGIEYKTDKQSETGLLAFNDSDFADD